MEPPCKHIFLKKCFSFSKSGVTYGLYHCTTRGAEDSGRRFPDTLFNVFLRQSNNASVR